MIVWFVKDAYTVSLSVEINVCFCATQEENVKKVRLAMKANLPTPELAQLLIQLLDALLKDVQYV